jgi:uncharacterized damage-inducible protein DinB
MDKGMDRNGLMTLLEYNIYANALLLKTAANLNPDLLASQSSPSHGSARQLLHHMLSAETFFLGLCQGIQTGIDRDALPGIPEISAAWEKLAREQKAYIASLPETDLDRIVPFEIRGNALHFPVWQLLAQSFIHSIHHRGELSIVLTGLGAPLPTLDIILQFTALNGETWPST